MQNEKEKIEDKRKILAERTKEILEMFEKIKKDENKVEKR